jgi:hypothetical protein
MTAQNSVRSYLGIAKETTSGTPVAPTNFIPVSMSKLKPVDVIDPLYDEGLRGSNVKNYAYIPGRTRSTFDFGGPAFPDTLPWAVSGILGSVATSGASAPYTHVVSLENASATATETQPASFTLTDFYATDVRAYAGCRVHDFSLNFSAEGLLEYDAKATGWLSTTASTPTPSFSTLLPVPVWQATVTIGGTQVSNAVEGSIKMVRPVTPIYGLANTQNPFAVFLGALDASGSFKFIMETNAELTRYLTNTQPSITISWSNGTGATATQIQATLTKGAYHAATIERSKDFVEVAVDFTGIANTTDAGTTAGYSPIKWTFQNAVATNIYQ